MFEMLKPDTRSSTSTSTSSAAAADALKIILLIIIALSAFSVARSSSSMMAREENTCAARMGHLSWPVRTILLIVIIVSALWDIVVSILLLFLLFTFAIPPCQKATA